MYSKFLLSGSLGDGSDKLGSYSSSSSVTPTHVVSVAVTGFYSSSKTSWYEGGAETDGDIYTGLSRGKSLFIRFFNIITLGELMADLYASLSILECAGKL